MTNRLALLLGMFLIIGITTITSCKKDENDTSNDPITQAFFEGIEKNFTEYTGMIDIGGSGYTDVNAKIPADSLTMIVKVKGLQPGTFNSANNSASITLLTASSYYSSVYAGGRATVNWTKRDDAAKRIEGTFSGTVVNLNNSADSIRITNGVYRATF